MRLCDASVFSASVDKIVLNQLFAVVCVKCDRLVLLSFCQDCPFLSLFFISFVCIILGSHVLTMFCVFIQGILPCFWFLWPLACLLYIEYFVTLKSILGRVKISSIL